MQTNVSIAEGVYLIGVNDRRTALFENIWPIPYGVSYNSYLIRDDKCALLDTVEFGSRVRISTGLRRYSESGSSTIWW